MATLSLEEKATNLEKIELDQFKSWMSGDRFDFSYSPKTIKQYHRIASDLVNFAKDEQLVSLDELNKAWLRKFILRDKNRIIDKEPAKYAPTTRIIRQSALNLFWRWAMEKNHAFDNPIEKLVDERAKDRKAAGGYGGRKPKRKPKVLSWAQQDALIDAVLENPRRFSGARDYALIMTLIETGLRSEEICNVLIQDLDMSAGRLRVIGKGNKERIIRFSPDELKSSMDVWLPMRATTLLHRGIDSGTLFITSTGARITTQLVYQQVSGYLKISGIREKSHDENGNKMARGPHLLRHTAASRMLARGLPIRQVMENLGHETMATTEIYAHLLD